MAATRVQKIGIGAQVGLGILTVIDFFENRSVGWLTGIAAAVAVAVSLWGLIDVARNTSASPRMRQLSLLWVIPLLAGAVGSTFVVLTEWLDYDDRAAGFSSEGVSLHRDASLPRCATVTGVAPAGDGHVWVAHTEAEVTERWFLTPAERTEPDGPEWTVDLVLGGDPGPSGAPADGPEYELVAFVVGEAGDAFLRNRGYAAADSVTGLVHFGALPPGVSGDGNSMTATRLAGPGGPCRPR